MSNYATQHFLTSASQHFLNSAIQEISMQRFLFRLYALLERVQMRAYCFATRQKLPEEYR